ncbi:MAG: hypothetical protein ACREGC_01295, partial [Minisyncoccia bacterium]
ISSPAEIFSQLQSMAQDGNPYAECHLIDLIYESTNETLLPAEYRSGASRFAMLKSKAEAGNHHAQKCLCEAIYYGMLDQQDRPPQERLADLEELARCGNIHAERMLANSLFESAVDPRPRLKDDDAVEGLKAIANGESGAKLYAQELIHAAPHWQKRPRKMFGRESFVVNAIKDAQTFVELKEQAARGSQDAWEKVICAIYNGDIGQGNRADSDRFAELCTLSRTSDPAARRFAKKMIGRALTEGTLGQGDRPKEERLAKLQTMAVVAGSIDIQYNQVSKLANVPAKSFWLYYDFYNSLIKALMPEPLEEE